MICKINTYNYEIKKDHIWNRLFVILFAICFFLVLYGADVVSPFNTKWLMTANGDTTQHYLGWKAFSKADWMFPLGMINSLSYYRYISIIFADSIPIFAILFKIILPIFGNADIQYIGLWELINFVLIGCFVQNIFEKRINKRIMLLIICLLFLLSPIMLQRAFFHTALSSHWMILMALEPIFNYNKSKKNYLYYFILGVLVGSVHLYFFPICFLGLMGYCIIDIGQTHKIWKSFILCIGYIGLAVFTVWCLGGLSSQSQVSAATGQMGEAALNLNSFINSLGWFSLLPSLQLNTKYAHESLAYMGLGMSLVVIIGIGLSIWYFMIKQAGGSILKTYRWHFVGIIIVFIIAWIWALSPTIAWGNTVVLQYTLPEIVLRYLTTFRSTGRFGWICVYLLEIASMIILTKYLNNKKLVILLFLAIIVQFIDLKDKLVEIHTDYHTETTYENPFLENPLMQDIVNDEEIEHIYADYNFWTYEMYAIANISLDSNKTLNHFPFARELYTKYIYDKAIENKDTDSIFIYKPNEDNSVFDSEIKDMYYYPMGDYIVGSFRKLEY